MVSERPGADSTSEPWTPTGGSGPSDARLSAPSALRNRDPILAVLRSILPAQGTVLEIASGSGEHIAHFAAALPGLHFQPSDPDAAALASIEARRRDAGLANLAAPLRLDVHETPWPFAGADAVLCINMIHIAPWSATPALFDGAAATLPPGAPLVLYGPYRLPARDLEPSNRAFDESLRARDPRWGVRELAQVAAEAAKRGFGSPDLTKMPANNLLVTFRRL